MHTYINGYASVHKYLDILIHLDSTIYYIQVVTVDNNAACSLYIFPYNKDQLTSVQMQKLWTRPFHFIMYVLRIGSRISQWIGLFVCVRACACVNVCVSMQMRCANRYCGYPDNKQSLSARTHSRTCTYIARCMHTSMHAYLHTRNNMYVQHIQMRCIHT